MRFAAYSIMCANHLQWFHHCRMSLFHWVYLFKHAHA